MPASRHRDPAIADLELRYDAVIQLVPAIGDHVPGRRHTAQRLRIARAAPAAAPACCSARRRADHRRRSGLRDPDAGRRRDQRAVPGDQRPHDRRAVTRPYRRSPAVRRLQAPVHRHRHRQTRGSQAHVPDADMAGSHRAGPWTRSVPSASGAPPRRAELAVMAGLVTGRPGIGYSVRLGDLKLFELITMLRLSRYGTAKSAVAYGLQGGRVSASACSTGAPWGDGGPTPPRRLAPSGSAIAKTEASVVPSGGSCTNSPGRPSAHSRCSSSRRAQCPHRPTPARKAAHRESSASESSSARIRVTDSWSFGRSRVTVFHTTSRSISK